MNYFCFSCCMRRCCWLSSSLFVGISLTSVKALLLDFSIYSKVTTVGWSGVIKGFEDYFTVSRWFCFSNEIEGSFYYYYCTTSNTFFSVVAELLILASVFCLLFARTYGLIGVSWGTMTAASWSLDSSTFLTWHKTYNSRFGHSSELNGFSALYLFFSFKITACIL